MTRVELRRAMLADEDFMRGGVAGVKAWRERRVRPLTEVLLSATEQTPDEVRKGYRALLAKLWRGLSRGERP